MQILNPDLQLNLAPFNLQEELSALGFPNRIDEGYIDGSQDHKSFRKVLIDQLDNLNDEKAKT